MRGSVRRSRNLRCREFRECAGGRGRGPADGEPEAPSRANNLREPVKGDYGAPGRFDDRAKTERVQLWAAEHIGGYRGVAGLAALALAAMVSGAMTLQRQSRCVRRDRRRHRHVLRA